VKSDPAPMTVICQSNLCLAEILVFVRPSTEGTSVWKRYLVGQFEVTTFKKNTTTDVLKRTQNFWATHLCKHMTFMQGVATFAREKYEEKQMSLEEPFSNDIFISTVDNFMTCSVVVFCGLA
jgi:hypothetical protein